MIKKLLTISLITLSGISNANTLNKPDSIPNKIDSLKVVIPIYEQKVSFHLPKTWKAAFKDQKPGMFMIEFTPKNEEIKSWKNLLSIQGFKGLSSKLTSSQFLDILASNFKRVCGENTIYNKLDPMKIDGYVSSTAILGCSNMPDSHPTGLSKGQSEIGYYYSIQGEKDIYLIHRSIRGESFSINNSPLHKKNILASIKPMMPIELCKKDGHQAECKK